MNRTKKVRFGLAGILAAALVALGAFLLVSQASAVTGTLSISSPTIAPGGSGDAVITANVPSPGLGAWTVDVTYDPTKLTVTGCQASGDGVCNPTFASNKVRIAGASAGGHIGDYTIGTLTLKASGTGGNCATTTPLTLSTNVFSDATVGQPAPVTLSGGGPVNGSVNCAAATNTPVATTPAATTAAAATATRVPGIAGTGFGQGSGGGGSSTWLLVGLAGTGLAALAGYGALRIRRKAA